jgi:uncharacterized protein
MRLKTTRQNDRQLFVSVKLAEVCNLACKYCYFFEHDDHSFQGAPVYMSREVVSAAARFLADGARDLGIKTVEVALHGGEPLMIGKDRMREVCDVFADVLSQTTTPRIAVQTNGLLLDDEWIDLFAERGVGIGLSIDGTKADHDLSRIDKKGRGSYDRVIEALRLLQVAQEEGRIPSYGVLAVVAPTANGAETYRHCVDTLKIDNIDFLYPQLDYLTGTAEGASHIDRFYLEVAEEWLKDNNPTIRIRTLEMIFRSLLTDDAAAWRLNYIADTLEGLSIRSNGDVCADDSIPPLDKRFRDEKTSVFSGTLKEFYAQPVWTLLREGLLDFDRQCSECEWLGLCAGGPPENRFDGETFSRSSIYCESYKSLFERIYGYLAQSFATDELRSRLTFARQNLMQLEAC